MAHRPLEEFLTEKRSAGPSDHLTLRPRRLVPTGRGSRHLTYRSLPFPFSGSARRPPVLLGGVCLVVDKAPRSTRTGCKHSRDALKSAGFNEERTSMTRGDKVGWA